MNINIKIDAEGLEGAILKLTKALSGGAPLTASEISPAEDGPKEVEPKEDQPKKVDKPKKEGKPTVTLEVVRTKLAELAQAGKQAEVKELITSFEAKKLSDIKVEDYAELLKKAGEI
ncbi:hypothetical protein KQI76_06905 [Amphibacillus sp. MSJ-3]|uniref:hypothetical protein n=1 Tax=Amphibacillus sp. MSJ-3 TaxID=2841505 RepID=UPI001C0EE183|nr:hypothetical protein [Amphibacillus sp. MSJ-3]MBU5594890.1 hypothetical protein [Amphibacillus sp. MSJ-3]